MKGGEGSHWEGCENSHHDCALAKLRDALAALQEARESEEQAVRIRKQVEKTLTTADQSLTETLAKLGAERERAEIALGQFRHAAKTAADNHEKLMAERERAEALALKLVALDSELHGARNRRQEIAAELTKYIQALEAEKERAAALEHELDSVREAMAAVQIADDERYQTLAARNAELAGKVQGFIEAVEAAETHHQWVRDGSRGQHVPFHGDFASANPSVMKRLLWWCRELKTVLAGSPTDPHKLTCFVSELWSGYRRAVCSCGWKSEEARSEAELRAMHSTHVPGSPTELKESPDAER